MTAFFRISCLLLSVVVLPSIAYAGMGDELLKDALKTEKELRDKTSIFERNPDFGRAIDMYSRALESGDLSSAGKARALRNRAGLYVAQGNCSAAIQDLDQTLKLQPKQVRAYALRGSCFKQARSYKDALDEFNRAVALVPNDSLLLAERAAIYSALGEHDMAVRDYTDSIKFFRPRESSDLFVERGDAFLAQGKYERAIEDYRRAVQIIRKTGATLSPGSSGAEIKQLQPVFARLGDAYHALAKGK